MRWESITAVVMLVAFWGTSLWTLVKVIVRDGTVYWWWQDFLTALPFFVLCPIFAVIGLRHSRGATRTWAACVLGLWVLSPQTWYMLGYFAMAMAMR